MILLAVAYQLNFHISFYLFASIGLFLATYQVFLIKEEDTEKCLKAFKNNNWLGLAILIGSITGVSL